MSIRKDRKRQLTDLKNYIKTTQEKIHTYDKQIDLFMKKREILKKCLKDSKLEFLDLKNHHCDPRLELLTACLDGIDELSKLVLSYSEENYCHIHQELYYDDIASGVAGGSASVFNYDASKKCFKCLREKGGKRVYAKHYLRGNVELCVIEEDELTYKAIIYPLNPIDRYVLDQWTVEPHQYIAAHLGYIKIFDGHLNTRFKTKFRPGVCIEYKNEHRCSLHCSQLCLNTFFHLELKPDPEYKGQIDDSENIHDTIGNIQDYTYDHGNNFYRSHNLLSSDDDESTDDDSNKSENNDDDTN